MPTQPLWAQTLRTHTHMYIHTSTYTWMPRHNLHIHTQTHMDTHTYDAHTYDRHSVYMHTHMHIHRHTCPAQARPCSQEACCSFPYARTLEPGIISLPAFT